MKTVGGVAETRLCLRTDGRKDGRTDGRTQNYSPLRLTSGDNKRHRDPKSGALTTRPRGGFLWIHGKIGISVFHCMVPLVFVDFLYKQAAVLLWILGSGQYSSPLCAHIQLYGLLWYGFYLYDHNCKHSLIADLLICATIFCNEQHFA